MGLLKANEFDALLIPGGYGVAVNLSDFALKGRYMQVNPEVAIALKEFHEAGKVIGMTCTAPILAAKVLAETKLKLTLGKHDNNFRFSETIDFAASLGHKIKELDVNDVCVDWQNLIVTTPCFLQDDATYF